MNSRTRLWYRVTVSLSVINLAAAGFALGTNGPRHALVHVLLTAGFGVWAYWLKKRPEVPDAHTLQDQVDQQAAELEDAQANLADQASQLAELQERLDFNERILAQVKERPAPEVRKDQNQ